MPKVPSDLNGRQVRKVFERAGFVVTRQKGSHMVMYRPEPKARLVVPDHDPIRVGTLRQLISDSGMTVEQFLALL